MYTVFPFILALLAQTDAAMVVLGDPSGVTDAGMMRAALPHLTGTRLIETEQVWQRLLGRAARASDLSALARMLDDAREREARFDSVGANGLRREIVRAFEHSAAPTEALRRLAARALHDIAAALLTEGRPDDALATARQALRRFPQDPVDAERHPPAVVELFQSASEELSEAPRAELVVLSTAPGDVIVDGSVLGRSRGRLAHRLPLGTYRVWVVTGGGVALPHVVQLGADGAEISIDAELESCLTLVPRPALRCEPSWQEHIERLAEQLDVERLVGVVAAGPIPEWAEDLSASGLRLAALQDPPDLPVAVARFSPWYLLPFGIGQLAQDRPAFGVSYLAAQTGLLGWHVVSWYRHERAVRDQLASEPSLRRQRNLSAALFYGTIAATIAEAVAYGLLFGGE